MPRCVSYQAASAAGSRARKNRPPIPVTLAIRVPSPLLHSCIMRQDVALSPEPRGGNRQIALGQLMSCFDHLRVEIGATFAQRRLQLRRQAAIGIALA